MGAFSPAFAFCGFYVASTSGAVTLSDAAVTSMTLTDASVSTTTMVLSDRDVTTMTTSDVVAVP